MITMTSCSFFHRVSLKQAVYRRTVAAVLKNSGYGSYVLARLAFGFGGVTGGYGGDEGEGWFVKSV